MRVSASGRILRRGPAGADRAFFISLLPLQALVFCVDVGDCVCVCQQAWSALCGSDVEVIDSRAVTRAIESSCGKRETLEPHSFQPWGGEGDKNRERGNPHRLKGDTGTLFELINARVAEDPICLALMDTMWSNKNGEDENVTYLKNKKHFDNHPANCLISRVRNPGDHRALWEMAQACGVMSYAGDGSSSPWLIRQREGKYKLQRLKYSLINLRRGPSYSLERSLLHNAHKSSGKALPYFRIMTKSLNHVAVLLLMSKICCMPWFCVYGLKFGLCTFCNLCVFLDISCHRKLH